MIDSLSPYFMLKSPLTPLHLSPSFIFNPTLLNSIVHYSRTPHTGALKTTITLSPLKNILLANLSLLTLLPFFPLAFLVVSVHNSLTFSKTILQCRSNAFTRATNLWLFRREMITGALVSTAFLRRDIGPLAISYSSSFCNCSSSSSDFGISTSSLVSSWSAWFSWAILTPLNVFFQVIIILGERGANMKSHFWR